MVLACVRQKGDRCVRALNTHHLPPFLFSPHFFLYLFLNLFSYTFLLSQCMKNHCNGQALSFLGFDEWCIWSSGLSVICRLLLYFGYNWVNCSIFPKHDVTFFPILFMLGIPNHLFYNDLDDRYQGRLSLVRVQFNSCTYVISIIFIC